MFKLLYTHSYKNSSSNLRRRRKRGKERKWTREEEVVALRDAWKGTKEKCWAQKMECCGYICMYVLLSIFCLLFPSHFSPPFTLLHPLLPLVTIFFFLNLFHCIHCYYQPTNSIRLNVNHNGGASLSNYRDFILKVRTWDYWLRLSN